jgi:CRISPR-associated protein Cmr3
MSIEYLAITPRDPIIARDGRPFGKNQGIRMRSLDWPYPSVLVGSLRTMLGKMDGGFSDAKVRLLLDIAVAGPLPMKGTELYFPVPKDILVRKINGKMIVIPLRPVAIRDEEGCDLPDGFLIPTMLPTSIDEDFKPEKMPAFWSMKMMTDWLSNQSGFDFPLNADPTTDKEEDNPWEQDCSDKECNKEKSCFLKSPEKDERVHTGINSKTGVAAVEEGLLFMSVGLDLATKEKGGIICLAAKVESDGSFGTQISKLNEIHPFGGERRLAHWARIEEPFGWSCPKKVSSKLEQSDSKKIRMVLATPAIFSNGWLPGWLKNVNGYLEGTPPKASDDQKLRLISACVDRWKPISGWSAEAKSRGPKAIRRLVPAGSVYFFEIQDGKKASALAKSKWLESVCDDQQDRKDGFGLAVWGIW